jgi:hypothetical protein
MDTTTKDFGEDYLEKVLGVDEDEIKKLGVDSSSNKKQYSDINPETYKYKPNQVS